MSRVKFPFDLKAPERLSKPVAMMALSFGRAKPFFSSLAVFPAAPVQSMESKELTLKVLTTMLSVAPAAPDRRGYSFPLKSWFALATVFTAGISSAVSSEMDL